MEGQMKVAKGKPQVKKVDMYNSLLTISFLARALATDLLRLDSGEASDYESLTKKVVFVPVEKRKRMRGGIEDGLF